MRQGYPEDWDTIRREVYRRDDYTCQNCAARGGSWGDTELHAHHIVPKSKGGTHKKRNLVAVCKACHDAIHGGGMAPVPVEEGNLSDQIKEAIKRHYRTEEYEDGYARLGKSPENKTSTQQIVDNDRNTTYDGCPNCRGNTLTVSWVGLGPGSKVKVIECESCSAQYDEQIEKIDGEVQKTLNKVEDPSEIDATGSAFFKEIKDQIRLSFNI